jgi:hypothetical protein
VRCSGRALLTQAGQALMHRHKCRVVAFEMLGIFYSRTYACACGEQLRDMRTCKQACTCSHLPVRVLQLRMAGTLSPA